MAAQKLWLGHCIMRRIRLPPTVVPEWCTDSQWESTRYSLNMVACLVRSLLDYSSILHEQDNIGIFREMPETTG